MPGKRYTLLAVTCLGASAAFSVPAFAQDGGFSGTYVEAHADYLWSKVEPSGFDDAGDDPLTGYDTDTAGGGIAIGHDWQTNGFVFGLVASATFASVKGSTPLTTLTIPENEGITIEHHGFATDLNMLATFGGRAGVEVTRGVLIYAQGGVALGSVTITEIGDGAASVRDASPVGYAAGVGIDVNLDEHWSLGVAWQHYDLGDEDFAPSAYGPGTVGIDGDAATVGIKFRF